MSITFQGTFFNAENLQPHPVAVEAAAGRLWFKIGETETELTLDDVRFSDRLADLPCQLYLPGNRTIETTDHAAIDRLLAAHDRGRVAAVIHWLETRARFAAAATLLLVVSVVGLGYFGLPVMARRAALAVPDAIDRQAGNAALTAFNRMLAPSQLSASQRRHVQDLLTALVTKSGFKPPLRLEFRSMGGQFPNAFALPGGILVVSDELVQLASAEELQAVLAHELGHIEQRHSLQGVLRGSAALLFVSTITGDLSTITTFSSTIPFFLLQSGFSREFEEEADARALTLLTAAKIDWVHFAAVLQKLADARPKVGQDFSYLSTHPSTADRIKKIDPNGRAATRANRESAAPAAAKATAAARTTVSRPGPSATKTSAPAIATTDNRKRRNTHFGTAPKPLRQTPPDYPFAMRAAGVNGEVTVGFVVDLNGDVQEPVVIKSSRPEFEAAALAAVAQWKFEPGQQGGNKTMTRLSVPIVFNLNDEVDANASETAKPPFQIVLPEENVPPPKTPEPH